MKVILSRDVARLGKRNTVVEVPDGFALNKLLPQGLAVLANTANLKRVEAHAKGVAHSMAVEEENVQTILQAANSEPVTILADCNDKDHLFKAVKAQDVHDALVARGLTLNLAMIKPFEPIKALGSYVVGLEAGKVKGEITVVIKSK